MFFSLTVFVRRACSILSDKIEIFVDRMMVKKDRRTVGTTLVRIVGRV